MQVMDFTGSLTLIHPLERAALRWIQTYAQSFGGDKTKVVVWGE